MCSSVCSKKCSGLWALLKNYMQYSYNQYMWDRGRFSVPYSFPLICRAYLPFKYIPPFLCLSRARGASKNTPRTLALGVPCYGFNCVGSGGTRNRPLSHAGCRKAFPPHGEGGPLAVDEVPAKRILDSIVPGLVGQRTVPCPIF